MTAPSLCSWRYRTGSLSGSGSDRVLPQHLAVRHRAKAFSSVAARRGYRRARARRGLGAVLRARDRRGERCVHRDAQRRRHPAPPCVPRRHRRRPSAPGRRDDITTDGAAHPALRRVTPPSQGEHLYDSPVTTDGAEFGRGRRRSRRRAEPRPARGGDRARRAGARHRRRRLGQDPPAHPPRRVPDRASATSRRSRSSRSRSRTRPRAR